MLPSPAHLKPQYESGLPGFVRQLLLIGPAAILVAAILWRVGNDVPQPISRVVVPFLFCLGITFTVGGLTLIYGSRWLWAALRHKMMDHVQIKGHEEVLDLGCGRGYFLITLAERLTTGRVVGIDSWRTCEITTTEENTRRANVAEKVELHTGELYELPFESIRFDVIVSSGAIHRYPLPEDREQAVRELWRVLKTGGAFAIIDSSYSVDYERTLRTLGCTILSKHEPFLAPSFILLGKK
jgi:arsenite methyltransferase